MRASTRGKWIGCAAAAAVLTLGITVPGMADGAGAQEAKAAPAAADPPGDTFRPAQVTVYAVDVAKMSAFYQLVGFKEQYRVPPGDKPLFATMERGGFFVSLADYGAMRKESGVRTMRPSALQTSDVAVLVDTPAEVDGMVAKVRKAGGKVVMNPKEASWGERFAFVKDPSGNLVQISTHRTAAPTG